MTLYYLVMHWWTMIAGDAEFMLRLPSACFSIATVPILYVLGVEMFDRRVGLIAGLLFALNETSIEYAQTARSYAMLMMFVTLSTLCLMAKIKRDSLGKVYIVSSTCGIYTHIFGLFTLPVHWISLFYFRLSKKEFLTVTSSLLIITVLSIPAIVCAIIGDRGQHAWIPRTSFLKVLGLFGFFAGVFGGDNASSPLLEARAAILQSFYLAGLILALAWSPRKSRPALVLLSVSVIVPIIATVAISHFKPLFIFRYFVVCLPFFVLLTSYGISRIRPPILLMASLMAIAVVALYHDYLYYHDGPQQDWRDAIALVEDQGRAGDILIPYPFYTAFPIRYYAGRSKHPATFPVIYEVPRFHESQDPGIEKEQFQELGALWSATRANQNSRLWFVSDAWPVRIAEWLQDLAGKGSKVSVAHSV
jgi:mannosyltransferase